MEWTTLDQDISSPALNMQTYQTIL